MMEGTTMTTPRKTGRTKALVHQVKNDPKFPTGSMVLVEGREDEGVMSTSEWAKGKARTVKGYMEHGGKIEWIAEDALAMAPR